MPEPSGELIRELEKKRDELKARLLEVGDMRPGSLIGRFRKCGKPNCGCARVGATGHGPSWSLTKAVGGKTVTKIIPAGVAVEQTKGQIAQYKRFRVLMHELVDICEQLCDARLVQREVTSQEAAKKGGSRRPSRPKSSPRSKRS